ncbi:glycosyltransferase [Rhodococcus sp. MEB041]|uniref:glycosyltransferase n=1 Tax=Rhodococcus sp. MEB041 TaxID=3040323 RepID=UPI00255061FB|nr:glycosyltransferase [Rhodococcus sp. MEB041]
MTPKYEFAVLSHTSKSNALGRALAMATVAQSVGPVTVWAVDDGPTWPAAAKFGHSINLVSSSGTISWTSKRPDVRKILWISKGISPSLQIMKRALADCTQIIVVLDLDDDDAALAEMFRHRRTMNKLKLNALRKGHPRRIRMSQNMIAQRAQLFTFSTYSLAEVFPNTFTPRVRIPHVRPLEPKPRRRASAPELAVIKVGTFGTIRDHKGLSLIRELIQYDKAVEMHVFENSGLVASSLPSGRVVEHSVDEDLMHVYGCVDVALIPMSTESGADVQLPAKLIDAMRAGVPVVTSKSSAIYEIAGDTVTYLPDNTDVSEVRGRIDEAIARGGERVRSRFEETSSNSAAAAILKDFLDHADQRDSKIR